MNHLQPVNLHFQGCGKGWMIFLVEGIIVELPRWLFHLWCVKKNHYSGLEFLKLWLYLEP